MSRTFTVTARLNDRCQPEFRGALYEDPLHETLQARGVGSVEGGGTLQSSTGEISWCDVEIRLMSLDQELIDLVVAKLTSSGAPKGSKLIMPEGSDIAFGETEGFALYLNGTDLAPEVYAQSDVNVVIEELLKIFGEDSKLHGYFEGPRETALYFYGPSFGAMKDRSAQFLSSYPLCEKSRVEKIA